MKTSYKGVNFEGTMAEFTDFMKLVDSGVFGNKSKPTTSGKGTQTRVKLTDEEREAKRLEKNAKHKEEQKEWFNNLTETEKKEFIAKKDEQRAKRTYMQAISASKLNVELIIQKKHKGERVEREVYNTLFKAEMKKYGYDWSPKTK